MGNLSSDSFQQFLNGGEFDVSALTPEESVHLYRSYQRDIARLKEKIAPSVRQVERGETSPLDVEAMKERIRKRREEHLNAKDD